MRTPPPHILLLGPTRDAVSGVSTHLNQLFSSNLSTCFRLSQFQVGSEGRVESKTGLVLRAVISPFGLAARLVRQKCSIVHINTSLESKSYWRDLAYLTVAKILRRKAIYQVHGGALPQDFFARSRILTALLRRVLSWSDVVVLLSTAEIAAYRAFVPDARLELIANAIEIPEADISAARYEGDRPLEVVYVGRLAADKGVFEIVEAARILRDRGVAVRFSFAGTGPAEARLRAAINFGELNGRITLLGAVFGAAKERLWQQSDVFAFPTYHLEGLPYALLEAMAAGAVPVISPVGAIPDVMQHDVHGVFVPSRSPLALADALQHLACNRELMLRLALAGRSRVKEQYAVARLAADFRQLYASLA